jgi:outer membrane protein OmpA-like peptidoglycan-associated protein/tetratricopeptide (TPR) repeat protein
MALLTHIAQSAVRRHTAVGIQGLLILLGIFAFAGLSAQNARLRRGHHFYEEMVYPKAVLAYTRGLKRQPDPLAYERLGDAHRQLSQTKQAEAAYAQAVKFPEASTSAKLHYADMLKANGNYAEAKKWYQAYLLTGAEPNRAARAIEGCDLALALRADSSHYVIAAEAFNTKGSEFAPVIYQQGLLITKEKQGGWRRTFNLRNYNHFYDLVYVQKGINGKKYTFEKLKGKVNSRYHEGPATISGNQDELLFTRSFFVKNKRGLGPQNHSRLKLLLATFARGKWQNVVALPFNSEAYSCGHPALSRDAQTLVFASDMPGGFGGTDLYVSYRDGLGWSNPLNLGPGINTEGNERFPYLHEDGTLFFASDGLPGIGGMDIFAAPIEGSGWDGPQNLGYPLNSAADDFSIVWIRNRASGYLASNRAGSDDIYNFRRQTTLSGTIVDARTGLPIPGVQLRVRDVSGKDAQYITGADGKFNHKCAWGQELLLDGQATGFLPVSQRVQTNDIPAYADKDIILQMEPDLVFTFSGKVVDAQTKAPLPNARLRIIRPNGESLLTVDAQGKYSQRLDEETDYTVLAFAPGHVPQFFRMSTVGKKVTEDWVFNANLEPGNYLLVEGKTVAIQTEMLINKVEVPIADVEVHALNTRTREEIGSVVSRSDGRFWQILKPGPAKHLVANKSGYFVSRVNLPSTRADQDTSIVVTIPIVPYEVGAIVKVIYYEYNKSDLQESASSDLNDIVYFLRANPEASVELSSHTDSRGGASFNERLSQSRADAAVNYIVSKGVAHRRIKAKGYGESMPINACKDETECTEEQHAQNRRTEIKVIRIDDAGRGN